MKTTLSLIRRAVPTAAALLTCIAFAGCFPNYEGEASWTVGGTVKDANDAGIDGIRVTCEFSEGSEPAVVVVTTGASGADAGSCGIADAGCTAGQYQCEHGTFGGGPDGPRFAAIPVKVTFEDIDGTEGGHFQTRVETVTVEPSVDGTAKQHLLDVQLSPAQ